MKRRGRARTARACALAGMALIAACGGDAGDRPSDTSPADSAAAPIPRMVPAPAAEEPATHDTAAAADPAEPEPRSNATSASDTAQGAEALRRAAQAYASLESLRADFTMEMVNPLLRRTTTSRGTLVQRTPDRIALRFTEPEGDIIVGDGTYFWVYYPSINPDQVTRAPAAQAGSGGVDLRAQFLGDPLERFDWTYEGSEAVDGRPATVLTLVPKEAAGYRQLKVWIDDADGLARRFEIHEHNGSTRTFVLSSLDRNPALADTLFRFEPPEGVRIVSPPRTS